MKTNYEEKISKINEERKIMLSMLKDRLTVGRDYLSLDINSVMQALNYDETNTEKYKAILKAKQLILDLTEQIINAKTAEDIISLRSKLNYYINKVKKEMQRRNIGSTLFAQLDDSVSNLRKDIATYLCYIKREKNIAEITNLTENIDALSAEERDKLKRLLKNERQYNNRNMKAKTENDLKDSENVTSNEETKKDITNTQISDDETLILKGETLNIDDYIELVQDPITRVWQPLSADYLTGLVQNKKSLVPQLCLPASISKQDDNPFIWSETAHSKEDRLALTEMQKRSGQITFASQISFLQGHYYFAELEHYTGAFFGNIRSFFRNIPKVIDNKRTIKTLKSDYELFYHTNALKAYIDYSKKRYSINTALQMIFKSSALSKREAECLMNHNQCLDWINEFYYDMERPLAL